jgi:hypothetical protein
LLLLSGRRDPWEDKKNSEQGCRSLEAGAGAGASAWRPATRHCFVGVVYEAGVDTWSKEAGGGRWSMRVTAMVVD